MGVLTPQSNSNQVPANSILDLNGKQIYLGNAFTTGVSGVNTTTGETPLMLLTNPSTNNISVFNFVRKSSITANSSTNQGFLRMYSNPVIGANGNALTPQNLRINVNSPSSQILAYSGPTISSNGTLIVDTDMGSIVNTQIDNLLVVLDSGNSILITGNSTSGTMSFSMAWYEL